MLMINKLCSFNKRQKSNSVVILIIAKVHYNMFLMSLFKLCSNFFSKLIFFNIMTPRIFFSIIEKKNTNLRLLI